MPALILIPVAVAAAVGVALASRKEGEVPKPALDEPKGEVPHTLTGTVGPVVYTLERTDSDYRWSIADGPSGADNSVKSALRTMFETALAMPNVRPSDAVTGAAGPYTFTVDEDSGGGWKWIGTDLGAGGAATAGLGKGASRGIAILGALGWLRDHGAVDWIARPRRIDEPPAASAGGAAAPAGIGKKAAAATVLPLEQEGPYPGLAVRQDGTVHVVDAAAWHAFARPIIRNVLSTGGPSSVGDLAGTVFGEVPGEGITFSGRSRKDTWKKVGDAIAKIRAKANFVPAPDEWLADLLVGRQLSYQGATATYKSHAIVARPKAGAWAWEVWSGGRGLDGAGIGGVAKSAALAIGEAKAAINAKGAPLAAKVVKPDCQTKPRIKYASRNLPSVLWTDHKTKEVDLITLQPKPNCHRFRVVVGVCIRTRSGATYGLMDLAVRGWPPQAKPGSFELQSSYPKNFPGFQISPFDPNTDTSSFGLPGVWKQLLRTHVTYGPEGEVVDEPSIREMDPLVDPCPSSSPRWPAVDMGIVGADGINRPWNLPRVELFTVGKNVKARIHYQGLPVFDETGRARLGVAGGGLLLQWKVWTIGEE